MNDTITDQACKRRELNDRFRATFLGGRVYLTSGVEALGEARMTKLLDMVRAYDRFEAENDPYGEHDFGAFEDDGESFFWKIDYFDLQMEYGSPDPVRSGRHDARADFDAGERILNELLSR